NFHDFIGGHCPNLPPAFIAAQAAFFGLNHGFPREGLRSLRLWKGAGDTITDEPDPGDGHQSRALRHRTEKALKTLRRVIAAGTHLLSLITRYSTCRTPRIGERSRIQ